MADVHFGSMVMEDSGKGPAVVMVHGLGGSSNSFESTLSALGDFRVLRPDLPGAGRSASRPGKPGLWGLASALKDILHAADVDRAHFVGHSMGTLICQYLAATSPDMVETLTLFGAILEPPIAARQALRERAAIAREQGMVSIAEAVSSGSVDDSSQRQNPLIKAFVRESLMRQKPSWYALHCEALSEAETVDYEAICCPTLLIAGERDSVAPVSMGRELASRIRDAHLEVIPGVGHWIMIEAVERSNELLRGYLKAHLDVFGADVFGADALLGKTKL